jgi:hypothetical protein
MALPPGQRAYVGPPPRFGLDTYMRRRAVTPSDFKLRNAEGYRAMAREAGQAVTSFDVRRQFVDGSTVYSITRARRPRSCAASLTPGRRSTSSA